MNLSNDDDKVLCLGAHLEELDNVRHRQLDSLKGGNDYGIDLLASVFSGSQPYSMLRRRWYFHQGMIMTDEKSCNELVK